MTQTVVRHLILKDLFLARWMMVSSIATGIAALAIMPLGGAFAYVGSVSFFCVLIILNIVLVMVGVVQERKDKVLLFVLSLPVSTSQYIAAKVVANAVAFVVPWLVLTIAAIGVIAFSSIPNGILPFFITVLGYVLFYYCILLAVALVRHGTGWHAAVITAGNISVNFVIPYLLSLPSIARHRESPTAVWTADIAAFFGVEIAVGAAAVALAWRIASRRSDFV